MAKGRKKTPITVKKTRGTLRPDRVPENMPEPSDKGMSPSPMVNERVRACFDFLHPLVAGMGNDSETFGPALSLAALNMERIVRLAEEIEQEGETYTSMGRNGIQIKKNPKVEIFDSAMVHFKALLTEFGMTPAAIQKVGSSKKKKKSAFAEFIGD